MYCWSWTKLVFSNVLSSQLTQLSFSIFSFARTKYLIFHAYHQSRLILYRVTPSRVHIMIYSRRRYNEVVKSIFSLVKVRIIEGSNKRIDASFDLSPASPHPLLLKNRRQTRCRCDQSVSLFPLYASIFIAVSLLCTNDRSRFFIDEKWKIVEVYDTVSQRSFTGWINGRERRWGERKLRSVCHSMPGWYRLRKFRWEFLFG